ncbi:MAG: hypothetical protein WC761_00500 [Candidatus Paceibacterota bacterium]|jgi:hypothetical protein
MNEQLFDEFVEKEFGVKWDPADFTFSILEGQIRFSPEMVQDVKSYYGISPRELFQFVREAVVKAKTKEEVDVVIKTVLAHRQAKEAIYKMSVVVSSSKVEIAKVYFSMPPTVPTEIKTK